MASTIQIKRGTGSAVPTGLADGELAINLDNRRLYFGSGSTSVNDFSFGEITAEKYIVSSSVLYVTTSFSSGSTEFGDTVDDTHTFTGHITASGGISASGDIKAHKYQSNGKNVGYYNTTSGYESIYLGYNNDLPIRIGKIGNPTTIVGHVTASGNISSSGTITGNSLVGTVGTATQGTIDHDSLANFVANEHIDHSGVSITAGAGLTGGGTIAATRDIAVGAGTGVTINANDVAIGQDVATTANVLFNHITASGNISSSGRVYGDRIYVGPLIFGSSPSTDKIRIGYDSSVDFLEYGKNATTSHFFKGTVTASGNISASGNIITDQILLNDGNKIIGHHGTDGFQIRTQNTDPIVFKTNGNNIRATISSTGEATFTNVVNATKLNTGQGDNELYAMNQDVETTDNVLFNNITATGNISSSGDISSSGIFTVGNASIGASLFASRVFPNGPSGPSIDQINNDISISTGLKVTTHITASGNISASGTVFTDTISSPSNNLIISSSTVKITSTTDGEANLILESDSDNNDENDNPFMLFTQDGGAINGYIGLTGDADKWPDGGTLTGATGNGLVLGTKGPTTSTNSQLFLAAGDAIRLTILNDGKVGIGTTTPSQELEVVGDIKLSGGLLSDSDMLYTADANGGSTSKHTFKENSATLLELSGVSASFAVPVKDGGRTIVKILPTDFVANDGGRPMMIEDDNIGSNELFLHSFGSFESYVYIEIPYGMTATHVKIFGSNTGENFTVYEANITNKTIAQKCSATAIESEADITDVPWTDSNYLVILVTSAGATDEIHGGYVKIEPS